MLFCLLVFRIIQIVRKPGSLGLANNMLLFIVERLLAHAETVRLVRKVDHLGVGPWLFSLYRGLGRRLQT